VLRGHKAALYAIRGFWKQLLHSEVPFTGVVAAFRRIEATRLAADRAYHTILERYPANIKVRSHACVWLCAGLTTTPTRRYAPLCAGHDAGARR
jgi:hypothetical protein